MAIQTIETLKTMFSAGKIPTQTDYSDLIDSLSSLSSTIKPDNVHVVSLTGYRGSGPDEFKAEGYDYNNNTNYDYYYPLKLEDILKFANLPSLGEYNYDNNYQDGSVLAIHNDGFWYHYYNFNNVNTNYPLGQGGSIFVSAPKYVGTEGTGAGASVIENDRAMEALDSRIIIEIPVGSAIVFIGRNSSYDNSEYHYVGGGKILTPDQLTTLKNGGSIDDETSSASVTPVVNVSDITINNISDGYESVTLSDILTATNTEVGDSNTIIIVNTNWAVGNNDLYISTGDNSIDSANGLTVLPLNTSCLFTKINNKWYPVNRPISITEYELSQLAQENTSSGS